MGILRKLWTGWKAFAHVLGKIQTTILLSVIYAIAIGAVSVVGKLLGRDLLALRRSGGTSYWRALPPTTRRLEDARRQF